MSVEIKNAKWLHDPGGVEHLSSDFIVLDR